MMIIQTILVTLYLLFQLTVAEPSLYVVDENTTICVEAFDSGVVLHVVRREGDVFFATLAGNNTNGLAGWIYEPVVLEETWIRATFDTDLGLLSVNEGEAEWYGNLTVGLDPRSLCMWTGLPTMEGDLSGDWSYPGDTDPVVNLCLDGEDPVTSYFFLYDDGTEEIGILEGVFTANNMVFYGHWVSEYIDCVPTEGTGYAMYLLDLSTDPITHIGWSAGLYEEYERLGNATTCDTQVLFDRHCEAVTTEHMVPSSSASSSEDNLETSEEISEEQVGESSDETEEDFAKFIFASLALLAFSLF